MFVNACCFPTVCERLMRVHQHTLVPRFERKEWVPARRLHKFASKFRELRPSRSQGVYSAEFWRAVDEAKTLYNEMLKIQRMQTCGICSKGDNEAILLLCSACERACHIYCDNPPLREVPEGDWYCHKCRGATVLFLSPPSEASFHSFPCPLLCRDGVVGLYVQKRLPLVLWRHVSYFCCCMVLVLLLPVTCLSQPPPSHPQYDRKRGAEGESPGEGVPTKRPKM